MCDSVQNVAGTCLAAMQKRLLAAAGVLLVTLPIHPAQQPQQHVAHPQATPLELTSGMLSEAV
jgi:hypothetical protein